MLGVGTFCWSLVWLVTFGRSGHSHEVEYVITTIAEMPPQQAFESVQVSVPNQHVTKNVLETAVNAPSAALRIATTT